MAAGAYFAVSGMVEAGGSTVTRVSFRWVYQPNGTQDLVTGVSSGTTSLGVAQGFTFSTQVVGGVVADAYYLDPTCGCGSTTPGFWANNGTGGVHDMGVVPFESVTTAPDKTLGVGTGQYYENAQTVGRVGHVYVLVTRDGQDYAKLVIDSISPVEGNVFPKGDMNCDSNVNAVDALLTLRHSSSLPVNLPPECPRLG
jgi:hypothetical protein